jgi:hypothetical protein
VKIRNVNGECLDAPSGQSQVQLQIGDCLNDVNQQFAPSSAP